MELDCVVTGSTKSGSSSSVHPQNDANSSNTSTLIKRQVSSSEETFCFRLKAEFIVDERPSCLTSLDAPKPSIQGAEAAPVVKLKEEEQNEESGKKKKMRGMNKKRPRDAKVSLREKVCLSVLQGNICPFVAKGDDEQCPYNHDLTLLLQERPQDISEVGICP
jgi:hypothetical protein